MIFLLFCAEIHPAYAYLDPGAGSILLQGMVGGAAVVTTFFSLYYSKIKNFLCNLRKRKEQK